MLRIVSRVTFPFAKKKLVTAYPVLPLEEAIKVAKEKSKKTFDETLDFQLKLNVDPKHGDQMVRGTCVLPGGLGKKIVVAVLAPTNLVEASKEVTTFIYGRLVLTYTKPSKSSR